MYRPTAEKIAWGPLHEAQGRTAVILRTLGYEDRAARMEWCSSEWFAYRHLPTKRVKLMGSRCRDRLCNVCVRVRGGQVRQRVEKLLEGRGRIRMVTLTVVNGPDLADRLDHLKRSFLRLRRTFAWRDHVVGWGSFLEVTKGKGGWHPHLHVLYEGDYWPFEALKQAWAMVTGEPSIVWITGRGKIAQAVKYVVKPDTFENLDIVEWGELTRCMYSRRCVAFGGTLRGGVDMDVMEDGEEAIGAREEYEFIGRLDDVIADYLRGVRGPDTEDVIAAAVDMGILKRGSYGGGGGPTNGTEQKSEKRAAA